MTKPSDVPEDVWDAAVLLAGPAEPSYSPQGTRIKISRAIMAEREACAQVADCDCSNPGCERQEIADAIRNRSQT